MMLIEQITTAHDRDGSASQQERVMALTAPVRRALRGAAFEPRRHNVDSATPSVYAGHASSTQRLGMLMQPNDLQRSNNGRGGIRTHGTLSRTHTFQANIDSAGNEHERSTYSVTSSCLRHGRTETRPNSAQQRRRCVDSAPVAVDGRIVNRRLALLAMLAVLTGAFMPSCAAPTHTPRFALAPGAR